jgi:hypothetical protein
MNTLRILLFASAAFCLSGCAVGNGPSAEEKAVYMALAAKDLEIAQGEFAEFEAAYFEQAIPQAHAKLEEDVIQAEAALRAAGKFTPSASAKLRQRYGRLYLELEADIAEERSQWRKLGSKFTFGANTLKTLRQADRLARRETETLEKHNTALAVDVTGHLAQTVGEIKARQDALEAVKAAEKPPTAEEEPPRIEDPELAAEFDGEMAPGVIAK